MAETTIGTLLALILPRSPARCSAERPDQARSQRAQNAALPAGLAADRSHTGPPAGGRVQTTESQQQAPGPEQDHQHPQPDPDAGGPGHHGHRRPVFAREFLQPGKMAVAAVRENQAPEARDLDREAVFLTLRRSSSINPLRSDVSALLQVLLETLRSSGRIAPHLQVSGHAAARWFRL